MKRDTSDDQILFLSSDYRIRRVRKLKMCLDNCSLLPIHVTYGKWNLRADQLKYRIDLYLTPSEQLYLTCSMEASIKVLLSKVIQDFQVRLCSYLTISCALILVRIYAGLSVFCRFVHRNRRTHRDSTYTSHLLLLATITVVASSLNFTADVYCNWPTSITDLRILDHIWQWGLIFRAKEICGTDREQQVQYLWRRRLSRYEVKYPFDTVRYVITNYIYFSTVSLSHELEHVSDLA